MVLQVPVVRDITEVLMNIVADSSNIMTGIIFMRLSENSNPTLSFF